MKLRILTEYFIAMLFLAYCSSHAQNKCYSEQLLDGSEPLIAMGQDTTGHWWAVTSPFSRRYSMIIDGKKGIDADSLNQPKFSPMGDRHAYTMLRNGIWSIHVDDSIITLGAGRPGILTFSRNGVFAYSVIDGQSEMLHILKDDQTVSHILQNRVGDVHLSFDANNWGYVSKNATGFVVLLNEEDIGRYDQCIIAGFMVDNAMIHAGKQGELWRVFKNTEQLLSAPFLQHAQVNLMGTAFACSYGIGTRMSGYLYSPDFVQPLETSGYDRIDNIVVHPSEALMGLIASKSGTNYMLMNTAEYDAGIHIGMIRFTHDGKELYALGDSQQDPFMIVNGQKFVQKNSLDIQRPYAKAPETGTFAYATSSALMMQRMSDSFTFAGMMADYVSSPIFNHRLDAYQSLGIVNNRLFMMSCKP